MSNHVFFQVCLAVILYFCFCDFRSSFLKVYPGYFHSHMTHVSLRECSQTLRLFHCIRGPMTEPRVWSGKNIYDDFKSKKTVGLLVCGKIFQYGKC